MVAAPLTLLALVLATLVGCSAPHTDAKKAFYHGQYQVAADHIISGLDNPDTRERTQRIVTTYYPELRDRLWFKADRASEVYTVETVLLYQQIDRLLVALSSAKIVHPSLAEDLAIIQTKRPIIEKKTTQLLTKRAFLAVETGDYRSAVTHLREVLRYAPDHGPTLALLDKYERLATTRVALTQLTATPANWHKLDVVAEFEHDVDTTLRTDWEFLKPTHPTANNAFQVAVTLSLSERIITEQPILVEDTLSYSRMRNNTPTWRDYDFKYQQLEKRAVLAIKVMASVQLNGRPIGTISFQDYETQTVQSAMETVDLPLEYADIRFPTAYTLKRDANLHLDHQALAGDAIQAAAKKLAGELNQLRGTP